MMRRQRRRYGSSSAEALWRDDCGSALTGLLRKRCGETPVEALWGDPSLKRCAAIPTEALWRYACERALARRLRKRYGATPAQALWRDACGGAMARRLRKCSEEAPAEAAVARRLLEALWSDAYWKRCVAITHGSSLARCLRTRSDASKTA